MSKRYIYLKNGDDVVAQQLFGCESEKNKIVEKWKFRYGKKFGDLAVAEDPIAKKEKHKLPKGNKHVYGNMRFGARKSKIAGVNRSGYKD